jgi:hypothetical protein
VLLYRRAEEPAPDGEIIWGGPTLRRTFAATFAIR